MIEARRSGCGAGTADAPDDRPESRDLPPGALYLFVRARVALSGVVTLEVLGHLHFCMEDASSFFEAELRGIAKMLSVTKSPTPSDP